MAQSLTLLASLYHAQGKYTQAEPFYQRALAVFEKTLGADDPEVATALWNYVALLHDMGRDTEAQELGERALNIRVSHAESSRDPQELLEAGFLAYIYGPPDLAERVFAALLDVEPDNPAALEWRGFLSFIRWAETMDPESVEQSKSWFQKAIQVEPDMPELHYWIGLIDWTLAYRARMQLKRDNELIPNDPFPDGLRQKFTSEYSGIGMRASGTFRKPPPSRRTIGKPSPT